MSVRIDWEFGSLKRVKVEQRESFVAAAVSAEKAFLNAFDERLRDESAKAAYLAKYEEVFRKKKARFGNSPPVKCRCCGAKDKDLFLHYKHCFAVGVENVMNTQLYCSDCSLLDEVTSERLNASLCFFYENMWRPERRLPKKPKVVPAEVSTRRSERGAWLAAILGEDIKRYPEYLKSEEWQNRRADALHRARYACQLCNASDNGLDVHHRTYERVFNEWPSDLTVLCRDCHRKFHLAESGGVRSNV